MFTCGLCKADTRSYLNPPQDAEHKQASLGTNLMEEIGIKLGL